MSGRIALDAFGSDGRPDVEVEGALLAARAGLAITLVGDEDKIFSALGARRAEAEEATPSASTPSRP